MRKNHAAFLFLGKIKNPSSVFKKLREKKMPR